MHFLKAWHTHNINIMYSAKGLHFSAFIVLGGDPTVKRSVATGSRGKSSRHQSFITICMCPIRQHLQLDLPLSTTGNLEMLALQCGVRVASESDIIYTRALKIYNSIL